MERTFEIIGGLFALITMAVLWLYEVAQPIAIRILFSSACMYLFPYDKEFFFCIGFLASGYFLAIVRRLMGAKIT